LDSFGAANIDHGQAVSNIQFPEHAMDVIANRLLCQLKAHSDLLGDEANELRLAIGETRPAASVKAGHPRLRAPTPAKSERNRIKLRALIWVLGFLAGNSIEPRRR
jgi:hypothetical protein